MFPTPIYHEASIVLYHSLSYRKLFIRTFGAFSAELLTSIPRYHLVMPENLIKHPRHGHRVGWHRPFGSLLMLVRSSDFKTAMQRRWSFTISFLAVLI
ncbi:hypothetical protein BDV11DRAFT_189048, partial [Aspergillus similis]